jgi:hypothetical protein
MVHYNSKPKGKIELLSKINEKKRMQSSPRKSILQGETQDNKKGTKDLGFGILQGLFCLLAGLFLNSCGSFKQWVGIHRAPPDEFKANPLQRKLEIPPDLNEIPRESTEEKLPARKPSIYVAPSCKTAVPLSEGEKVLVEKIDSKDPL